MKYIDEFRDNKIAKKISRIIFRKAIGLRTINIMEVCGTHTMSICKFGIRSIVPENIKLLSGPGCPVCVTPKEYIDKAIAFSRLTGNIVTTFGDMMKVPGSYSTLSEERTRGRWVKVVYSVMDAVEIAERNPDKNVIFLGIGFETTSPTVSAGVIYVKKRGVKNFFVYPAHKLIIPAMETLLKDSEVNIEGFLCPAHVSTIIGTAPYSSISRKYNIPCVIAGFEPLDILEGILMIIEQIRTKKAKVENQYRRIVKKNGNKKAIRSMDEVFSVRDSEWRGLGKIHKSGLVLNKEYSSFDAEKHFSLPGIKTVLDRGCICGRVLKGVSVPSDCRLFARECSPLRPVGPCMVSSEGTCAAYYRYRL